MAASVALLVVPGVTTVGLAGAAHAAVLPANHSGSTHGDIAAIHELSVAETGLAAGELGHASTTLDSTTSPRVRALASNLYGAITGTAGATPETVEAQVAGPNAGDDVKTATLAEVPLAPLLTAGVINADVAAHWGGDTTCLADGTPWTSSTVDLADGATVGELDLAGTAVTLVTLGASQTTGTTERIGTSVVSTATGSTAPVEVLTVGGFPAITATVNDALLTSTSDGTTGTSTYNDPVIVLGIDQDVDGVVDQTVTLTDLPGDTFTQEIDLGVATASITLTGHSLQDQDAGAAAEGLVSSVLAVQVAVTDTVLGTDLASTDIGVLPLHTTAVAPSGGIECVVDTDGDGLSDADETNIYKTNPLLADTDGDGLTDGQEVDTDGTGPDTGTGTDPLLADTDGDGLTDGAEVNGTANTTYGDAPTDPLNPDSDGDGLTDGAEVTTHGTDPNDADTDDGGVNDGTEVTNGTEPVSTPTDDTPPLDSDGDGLSDADEASHGTDPSDADSDNDGLTDGAEVTTHGTDPRDRDTDDDGLADGREVKGYTVRMRGKTFSICGRGTVRRIFVRTDPRDADTDNDRLRDGLEANGYRIRQRVIYTRSGDSYVIGVVKTNPTRSDTDRDGLRDNVERTGSANTKFNRRKSDPTTCDTDRGGVGDGKEVSAGSDPTRIKSGPNDYNRTAARHGV